METAKPNLAACEYKTGKTLGQGSYGMVKEGVKISTGEKFAIKMISKKLMRGREQLVINEINVLKKVSKGHPNIVTLHDYFESPNNLYLVMDLCTGGELFDRIIDKGHFYEEDAAKIINIVCGAIKYLHEKHIVHRDIKPENLIFKSPDENSDLLVADFGLSKIADDQDSPLKTYVGTPGYMAPEILQKTGHGKPVDIWAIGVMSYFLVCGALPFENPNQASEMDNIINAKYSMKGEYWDDISSDAKSFISKSIIADPKERMTIEECLAHPWLAKSAPASAVDLLPRVRKGFNAKRMFKKAVDAVTLVNKLTHASSKPKLTASGNNLSVPGSSNVSSRSNSIHSFEEGVIPARKSDVGDP